MFFLKICFRDEDHLNVNSPFYTLTVYAKCLLFQFFSRGIRMHISILTGVQNGRISLQRNNHIFLKNVPFEPFFFRDEGHLYANCLAYILSFCFKCFLL